MPKAYEKMRDRFFQEKRSDWKRRNPHKSLNTSVRDRLYDNAQAKAARIYNADHPEKPLSHYKEKYAVKY